MHSTQNLTQLVEPFSTGHGLYATIRPWAAPENQGQPHDYHDLSVVAPPCYDTLPTTVRIGSRSDDFGSNSPAERPARRRTER